MKTAHSMFGLLAAILLISAPVTWLTSLDEPIFAIVKILLGLVCLAVWLRGLYVHRRGLVSGRGGVHLLVSAQWLAAVLIIGAVAIGYFEHRGTAWDMTSEQVYTVAEETRVLLEKMPETLKIEAYYGPHQGQGRVLKKLVEQLQASGADVDFELIDPSRDPKRTLAALISAESPKIILRLGKREERVRLPTEQQLAQGLQRLLGEARIIFVLRGHGEAELSGEDHAGFARLARELTGEGFTLAYLDLAKEGRVPSSAAALISLRAKTPFLEQELEIISLYMEVGGRLLIAGQAGLSTGLNPLLKSYGLSFAPGVVVDPQVSGAPEVQGQAAAMVAAYTDHAVVARLAASGLRTLLSRPAPIVMLRGSAGGRVQPLAAASAESWVQADPMERVMQRGAKDSGGALLAALWSDDRSKVEARRSDEARLGLLSDAGMMSNGGMVHAGNRALALNLINWLSDGDQEFAISAAERRVSRLFLTRQERSRLRLLLLDALPLFFLLPGLIVWQRRRRFL
jgi:hypothetical protein